MAKKPSFEVRLAKLEDIVRELEDGSIGLEDAVARYQDGMKVLKELQSHLNEMEKRIEIMNREGVVSEADPDHPGSGESA